MKLIKLILQNSRKNKKIFKSLSLLFLLTSFIFANLFGINFNFINWNLFSIFSIPLSFELVNFFTNKLKNNNKLNNIIQNKNPESINFYTSNYLILFIFDSLKRGFLLGIFIEAFKVGS